MASSISVDTLTTKTNPQKTIFSEHLNNAVECPLKLFKNMFLQIHQIRFNHGWPSMAFDERRPLFRPSKCGFSQMLSIYSALADDYFQFWIYFIFYLQNMLLVRI